MYSVIFYIICLYCIGPNPSSDAYDSSAEKLKFPVLEPGSPDAATPSSTGSDQTDFKVSPSLRDMVYSPELMVSRAVKIRRLDEMVNRFTTVKMSDIAEAAETSAPPKIAQQMRQARRLPTTGQIATMRAGSTGSPTYKGLAKSKFNNSRGALRTASFNSLKCGPEGKISLKREVKAVDDVFRTDSNKGSDNDLPQGCDDKHRRLTKYGVGYTVSEVPEAQAIIMGDRYPRLG